jgi:hypothetical protein
MEDKELEVAPAMLTLQDFAERHKSLTSLPRKPFDRQKVINAFEEAFELVGGVPRLALWADKNPTEFYRIFGKLLPTSSQQDIVAKGEFRIITALEASPLDEIPSDEVTDGEFEEKRSGD